MKECDEADLLTAAAPRKEPKEAVISKTRQLTLINSTTGERKNMYF